MSFWPPSVPTKRRDRAELLDSRSFPPIEVARSLRDVARINSFLNATKPLYDGVWNMIKNANLTRATVLDVGSGNGDFARRLVHQAQERGVEVRVLALDVSTMHQHIARAMTPSKLPVEFVGGDVFALPLRDCSVDIVTSSLFLHHFSQGQIEALLDECSRVARVGWLMNDCTRDGVALGAFRVLRPLLARSFITRFDALASVRRAYTPGEMRAIVASVPGARVRAYFPYRMQVEWSKS